MLILNLLTSALFVTPVFSFNNFLKLNYTDKEVVYKWRATLKSGTYAPKLHESVFTLTGDVRLQNEENSTMVKVSNLQYKISNGEETDKDFSAIDQSGGLDKVFKIVYNSTNGLIDKILTEDEEQFSRNIKKSLASILQLHSFVLETTGSRIVEEQSIYGLSNFIYTIKPINGTIIVQKSHQMSSASQLFKYFFTNLESKACDLPQEQMLMRDSFKEYHLVEDFPRRITTTSSIVYYPFKANSDYQFIRNEQILELSDILPLKEKFQMMEQYSDSLTYHPSELALDGAIDDITNRRRNLNKTKLINIAFKTVQKICTLENDNIKAKQLNKLQDILLKLNSTNLEQLQHLLIKDDNSVDIFYKILPFVGTEASTLFIKKLVLTGKIDSGTASTMVERIAENVISPTLSLLQNLEDLAHLNQSFAKSLRKAAVLSFGTLIHKSQAFYRRIGEDVPLDLYETYALEYLGKIKTESDYELKLTFYMSLINMRVESVGKFLQSDGFKLQMVWALANAVQNTNDLIPKLLTILTNEGEDTQVRILSYFFIMESKPNDSFLRLIFQILQKEKNPEVYNFHYTYIKAMMKTKEPCHQFFKTKMSQIFKITKPPTHGTSYFKRLDYQDPTGFSSSLSILLLKSTTSKIYFFFYETQEFNILNLDYGFYLKIYENESKTKFEAALIRHDNIIKTFYINEENFSFSTFFQNLKEQTLDFERNFTVVDYHKTYTAMIPLDLGVPVFWEHQMPELFQNFLKIQSNRSLIQVENDLNVWTYYRHGLCAYNSFLDVWQGVNRVQTFDQVLPLKFEIDINQKKISWIQREVAEFRISVKQLVFVMFDDERSLLDGGKSWTIVNSEDKYLHNYTLLETNFLGHNLSIDFHDSTSVFSIGELQHQLYVFFHTETKTFDSPLEHLVLSLDNLQRFYLLSPTPHSYTLILKVVPSQQYQTLTIDCDINVNNSTNFYTPETRFNILLNYNRGNSSSYDFRSLIELNSGHTVNVYNFEIIKKDSWKITVNAVKKFLPDEVNGNLNIIFDNSTIEVSMVGHKSLDSFDICQFENPKFNSFDCVLSASVVREYTYNINFSNIKNEELKSETLRCFDLLKNFYFEYYMHNVDNYLQENLKVDVFYPIQNNKFDLKSSNGYFFNGVPRDYLKWFGFYPDSLGYPIEFLSAVENDNVDRCTIKFYQYSLNGKTINYILPQSWTLYIEDEKISLYVKLLSNNTIAVEVSYGNNSMVINDGFGILRNGKTVPTTKQYSDEWIYYQFFEGERRFISVFLQESGLYFEYCGCKVEVVLSKVKKYKGLCYQN